MKLKEDFMLREVAGQWLLVPIGESVVNVNGIITLSESGVILWKELENGIPGEAGLADALMKEYEIDHETALESVREFLSDLKEKGII
jgi:hypothetical protein